MVKLHNDKVFRGNALKELETVGRKTMEMAQEISRDVGESLAAIQAQYEELPSGARQEGVECAIRAAKKRIGSGKIQSREKMPFQHGKRAGGSGSKV